MQVLLRHRKDAPKQEYRDVSVSFYGTQPHCFPLTRRVASRLNTFLELKMENQRLQHRINELRAHNAPLMQIPSTSMDPALAASTFPSNFGSNPSSTTSPFPAQLQPPVGPQPPTVPDHTESTVTNPSPVTRNLDATGFQEGEQDEPAKKKVRHVQSSVTAGTAMDT